MINSISHAIAKKNPDLYITLRQAQITDKPIDFVKKAIITAFILAIMISIVITIVLILFGKSPVLFLLLSPALFIISLMNELVKPTKIIARKRKEINRNIVFVGKFLIVEIKSGVPIYNALKTIATNYKGLGEYFQQIVNDIDIGTSTEEAINKAILTNPSENFQKIMWQIVNSLQTGADIAVSLGTVLEQINKKQLIEVERYGKKLNPIAMFYLMVAVIFPSLGMIILIVLVSFLNIKLTLITLISLAILIGFLQFMFYSVITGARPAVDM